MSQKKSAKQALGVFSLAMITAGSVDSIRNLPATAMFGSALIFFFFFAALFFLLPAALISAELASTSNQDGGVYTWVKNAFGQRAGFAAVWFQWVENIFYYPAILAYVAGTIGYLISPSLAQSKPFLITVIMVCFWGATIVNLLGIKSSARFSNFCAMAGLIIPMALIMGLGVVWLLSGAPLQIHLTKASMIPQLHTSYTWVALTGIMLSFCGMEIATVHSSDVHNPQKAYPRAMLIATLIIVVTLLAGALSIAIVLPEAQISLVSGIMQAFAAFFAAYHLHWILPFVAVMLVIGAMGTVNNWIIAPIRGLQIAIRDTELPAHWYRDNQKGAPVSLLIYQGIIVSFSTLVFLLLPSVNGSYWLLTALAAQLYMIMYLIMFVTAIKLRYQQHNQRPGFRIPVGNVGMWVVGIFGLIGSLVTFIVGFIPPSNINIGSTSHYEWLLLTGLLLMSAPPFILARNAKAVSEPFTDAADI